jgi:hypothetical protein
VISLICYIEMVVGGVLEFVVRFYMRGIAMLCDDTFQVMMCVS